MMTNRDQLIDNLRGFSMIVIIFTHVTAFFPSDKVVSILWNWSNFAVPIFIFCSVYLFLKKNTDKPILFFPFIKKRFMRLLIPYYIFLPFFLSVLFITSSDLLSWKYVWQSLLVIGGVDINWLVLLFLLLTLVLPFFSWSLQKAKVLFWAFFLVSLGSAVLLLFSKIDVPYKWIMWLPWSLMLYFTWFYVKLEQQKKKLFWLFAISGVVFFISFYLLDMMNSITVLRENKYPPNIFYITYGTTVLLGLTFIDKYLFGNKIVLQMLHFFSKYSYPIYFVHYLVLTFFASFIGALGLTWWSLFLLVLFSTVLLQKCYLWARMKIAL